MSGKDITHRLAKFFEIYEEIEFKNVKLFMKELSLEKMEVSVDNRLRIIELIQKINDYTQVVKPLLLMGKPVNMNQFSQQLLYLKKELDGYFSANHVNV